MISIVRRLEFVVRSTVVIVIMAPLELILFRSRCRTGHLWVTLMLTLLTILCRLLASGNGSDLTNWLCSVMFV